MIQFNPVFTKHLLSALLSCRTFYNIWIIFQHLLSLWILVFSTYGSFFVTFPFKCLSSHFALYLYACVNSWDGGHYASWLSGLMGHSSAVMLQMKRKWVLAGIVASSICVSCISGGCLASFISKEHKWSIYTLAWTYWDHAQRTTHTELQFHCLPQRVLWAQWHVWTGGSIPESKAGLENSFFGMRIETFFCINATLQHLICLAELPHLKAPRMQSILLIWVELKRKACRPDPRVTTLKSWCGQQPVEWRSCHRERRTHCGCLHVCS